MSYEYRAQMMNGTIKDAKDNYENAKGNAEKEKYEIEIQRLQSLQNAYKTAGDYEAKAKAWDRTQALLEKCTHQTPGNDYEVDWHEFEIKIDEVISDYESGEYDAKK